MSFLKVNGLTTKYRTRDMASTVLKDISIDIDASEIVGVIGESGSGKTTLIDALCDVLPFKNGSIEKGSMTFFEKKLSPFLGKQITYIPQNPTTAFDPLFSIENHFADICNAHLKDLSKGERKKRIEETLNLVDLSLDKCPLHSFPHQLSGGMKQRILIAMALITQPMCVLADEPTSNLDAMTQKRMLDLFTRVNKKEKIAILITTHNLALVKRICHRVYVLYRGRVVERGRSEEIFSRAQHQYTKMLLNALPKIDENPQEHKSSNNIFKIIEGEYTKHRMKQITQTHFVEEAL